MIAYREVELAFQAADSALARLIGTPTPGDLRLMSALLQAFIERCKILTDLISTLPHQILCC